ncbi:hypothetical protein INT44_001317 [Umbelopsis vinacea]|uniref:Neurochondrin-domain-containing protein n=1 Tax=Umbelopsis vinacea TaxID=44442 RepID=A0A8H7Q9S0_9FUNG|nr:hypothetical protein INT44_001317 [Umbelopsis vinacea]
MQVSSSKENRAAEIDQCLNLLSPSSSDESKFTALLILPRLLDSNDHATIQRVFDKMNFKFIERLMKSKKTAEVPETVMQEIAVNILSYFSTVESLTSSEQLIARIPTLSSCIKPRSINMFHSFHIASLLYLTDYNHCRDATDITKDVLMTLMRLAKTDSALQTILDKQVLSRILVLLGDDASQEEQDLAKHVIILVYGSAFNRLEQSNSTELKTSLIESLKYSLIPTLSSTLRVRQDTSKFVAVDILHRVFNECPTHIVKELEKEEKQRFDIWIESIRSGVRQILTSKTALLRHIGPRWLFSTLEKTASISPSPTTPRQAEKRPATATAEKPMVTDEASIDARFPALLIQLASLEVRLILDDLGGEKSAKAIEAEPASDRSIAMLPMFYQMIESAIQYLTSDDLVLEGTDIDLIFKIRQILTELFKAIIDFLNDTFSRTDQQDIFNDIVILASVRLLAIWIEEDDSLNNDMSSKTMTMVETFREQQL